jgi:hypothetical protein
MTTRPTLAQTYNLGAGERMHNEPAQSLDHLPRPGIAIPLARWLDLMAIEAENAKLRTALVALVAAEDASIVAFGHKEIDSITAAMEQARAVLKT